jgi:hypothetical protein
VGETGHRCPARTKLEYDHIEPVACGGASSLDNLRLRCRAHNQLEAERAFGTEFMRHKRDAARRQGRASRAAGETAADARDVEQPLRLLGFRVDEVRRAAAHCESMHGASLEDRMRVALRLLAPKAKVIQPTAAGASG